MRAKLANLNHCAVPFLSRAGVNSCWYYYTSNFIYSMLLYFKYKIVIVTWCKIFKEINILSNWLITLLLKWTANIKNRQSTFLETNTETSTVYLVHSNFQQYKVYSR